MTAVKAGDVGRVLERRPPGADLLLVYGPDAGLVSERAAAAARTFVDDPADQFQLIRMDGDALADEPARLVEEATTVGLFGGRRALWVRQTTRNIAPAVNACLQVGLTDTLVVIEACDLAKNSPLRIGCEASPRALALPCYGDEERGLSSFAEADLREHGFTIDRDALGFLVDNLGGDRLASRAELEKLRLYAHGQAAITLADIRAVVSDASATGLDDALAASFGGDRPALDAAMVTLAERGGSSSLLPLALRHALQLLAARDRLDGGADIDTALRIWRGLNQERRRNVTGQLRRWTMQRLPTVAADLQSALLATRRSPQLADVTVHRTLMRIAERVRQ